MATEAAVRVFPRGTRVVALGGGCLVNRRLLRGLAEGLGGAGFDVRMPRSLPPGDGGLSHGQAVLAALALSRGREPELKGDP
jgi:hydrogenase maturation protein HypF